MQNSFCGTVIAEQLPAYNPTPKTAKYADKTMCGGEEDKYRNTHEMPPATFCNAASLPVPPYRPGVSTSLPFVHG